MDSPKQNYPAILLPAITMLAAFMLYALSSGGKMLQQSLAPHYIHLADAFLQGDTNISDVGISMDIIQFEGKLYIPSPPLPAILLAPVVDRFGNTFSDVLFSVVLGAFNVAMVQAVFRKMPLTIFFALGTPHWYFSSLGSVWFQAQATAILFCLLSILFLRQHNYSLVASILAGLAWGLSLLARPTVAFATLLPLFLIWQHSDFLRSKITRAIAFMLPILASIVIMALYNYARFGDWGEFGYSYMLGAPNIIDAIAQNGTFSIEYLTCNLRVSLIEPPVVNNRISANLFEVCAHLLPDGQLPLAPKLIQPNPIGMSVFLASPLFFILPLSIIKARRNWFVWVSLLGVMLPNWMVHNTGSLQFGYRYWMDASVVWLLLLSNILDFQATSRWQKALIYCLIGLSIIINGWGHGWMFQNFTGLNWIESMLEMLFQLFASST